MAYDPNASYQAPRRGYYGQQQAPVQNGHGNYGQQQQAGYGQQYDQGYDQRYDQYNGYEQSYEQSDGYGHDMRQGSNPQSPQYSDGYYGGSSYQQPGRQEAGYGNGYEEHAYEQSRQRQDRHYDPRYQQRPEKSRPQNHAQQRPQREQQQPAYNQQRQNNYDQPQSARQQQYGQQVREQQPAYVQQSSDRGRQQNYNQSQQYNEQPERGRQQRYYQSEQEQQAAYVQQRPERGVQQSYEQPDRGRQQANNHQPKVLQKKQPPQDRPQEMFQSKPNPRNARMYPGEAQGQQQTMQQQNMELPAPPRIQDPANGRPSTAPHSGTRQNPAKSSTSTTVSLSMEEWKAKERARMHADAEGPEVLSWDNAFPMFPTKRERSRAAESRAGSDSAMGNRDSSDQARPSTSTGQRSERAEPRPSMLRNNSEVNTSSTPSEQPHTKQRQMSDQKSHAQEPIRDQSSHKEVLSPPQQRPEVQRYNTDNGGVSLQERQQQQQQQRALQQPAQSPPALQASRSKSPPQSNGLSQPDLQPPQPLYQPRSSSRPATSRSAAPQPIDTRQAQQQPNSTSEDPHPMSPGSIPPRPATSQTARSPLGQSMTSPTTPLSAGPAVQPAKPWPQSHAHQEGLSNIYSDYHDNRVPPPVTAPPRTRDEEIEADMPDFDSAAPGGTSLLHKRSRPQMPAQAAELSASPTPPPMPNVPPQQASSSAQYQPNQNQQLRDQRQVPQPAAPDQRQPKQKQGGITDGFVFGVPGEGTSNQQGQYHDDMYQQQQEQYQQVQSQYQPRSAPPAPAPAPYGQGQQRPVEDSRQMPYRQAPPQQNRPPPQRVPQNLPPPRGPMPPQGRPGVDRNFTGQSVQTSWSDPMQGRVAGSAPPTQQHFHEAPMATPSGAPVSQQRPYPNQQPQPQRHSNPDALPQHPVPVRPGLMEAGGSQPPKPPPVRIGANGPPAAPPTHQRQPSIEQPTQPVTNSELDRLRAAVDSQPNNNKQALHLAKRLVEAATVLASEGGRADQRTTAKNRERYIMEAHKRIKKLVTAGYPEAQFYLADCYGQGSLGLDVDTKEAFNLYQAAAKSGHGQAAYRTALCCELGPDDGGGTRKDYAKAVQWYRRGAALGDPDAMFKTGVILLKGLLGQQRNVGEACNFLKRTVERQGSENPRALFELAQLYESANTDPEVRNKVIADDRYARELFDQAANAGQKAAQFRLGQAYEYGNLGCPIDNRMSIMWYTKAAAQGEHQAELALSGWYLTGAEGILENSDTEAYLWARKAASSEPPLAKAMFAMGYFTEQGIGCPANTEEAKRWYNRAAAYKFPKAVERLEELKRNGSKGAKPGKAGSKLTRKDQKKMAY